MSTDTVTLPKTKTDKKTKQLPPYHVILLNDDDHSFEYVIDMLGQIFGHPRHKAENMAIEVDSSGRVIVDTTSKERAELKRDQIHAFGPDQRIVRCAGSMSATIEPAWSGDDEKHD